MRAKKDLTIANLRIGGEGIRGSFEEFCCQLFRRDSKVSKKSVFRRIHGAGGDGGVEATWIYTDGTVWGFTSVRLIVEQIHLVGRRLERRIGRAIEKRLS